MVHSAIVMTESGGIATSAPASTGVSSSRVPAWLPRSTIRSSSPETRIFACSEETWGAGDLDVVPGVAARG
jgi:hypothetical protein